MYLILGPPDDECSERVRQELEARGRPTLLIANPMEHPCRFAWQLDSVDSATALECHLPDSLRDDQIDGVLVRTSGGLDPARWEPRDGLYMQAETQAALLGWLWSLSCPVVNRCRAAFWFRMGSPLLCWGPLLRQCSVPVMDTLITNVEDDARAFGKQLMLAGAPGTVYSPLTTDTKYWLRATEDWQRLNAMMQCAPVCLTGSYEAPELACVVGGQVVWQHTPSEEALRIEPALCSFAEAAGLVFVEFALASTYRGRCVVDVQSFPRFVNFGDTAQRQIVDRIVDLLMYGHSFPLSTG